MEQEERRQSKDTARHPWERRGKRSSQPFQRPTQPERAAPSEKETFTAEVEGVTYQLNLVTYHDDGKTIAYRRMRAGEQRHFTPFNPSELSELELDSMAVALSLAKWPGRVIALFTGRLSTAA